VSPSTIWPATPWLPQYRGAPQQDREAPLERLKPPPTGDRVELGDTVVPGQMLRVTRGCVKSWSVLCKVRDEGGISEKTGRPLKGTQRRTTLGQYPIMGVKAAREAPIAVQNHSANARVLRSRTEWRTPRRALLAAGQNRGTSSSLSTSLTT
jgi:hypothetical protein